MPTDLRTRPVWRRSFSLPQPPFNEEQAAYCLNAAEALVSEVQAATGDARFPRQRWIDWLCRRTEAYYRTSRGIRERLRSPQDRHWFRVYQPHWLHAALLRTDFKYRRLLPPEMCGGHSPLSHPVAPWGGTTKGGRASPFTLPTVVHPRDEAEMEPGCSTYLRQASRMDCRVAGWVLAIAIGSAAR